MSELATIDRLHDYELVLFGGAETVEFKAADMSHALKRCEAIIPPACCASIVEDGVALGKIRYSSKGFWTVSDEEARRSVRA
jgi:hypothetical protein